LKFGTLFYHSRADGWLKVFYLSKILFDILALIVRFIVGPRVRNLRKN